MNLLFIILYQALQRPHQFVAHTAGIAVYAEAWSYVYRSEVGTVGAVAVPGDGDILTLEDARVALGACFVGSLHKRHVFVVFEVLAPHVPFQHALVALARLHPGVAPQEGLHVHTQFCILFPALLLRALRNYYRLFHIIHLICCFHLNYSWAYFFVCDATRMLTNEHEFFMNNIYETFMVIYGHFCSAAGI